MAEIVPGEYDTMINGIRIHYTIRGTGPAVIAHSGGPGFDARCWGDFAHIDDFLTVIAVHPRGSGLSGSSTEDAYMLTDYANDVESLRLHLGLDAPIVMGWSHGGMVAQQFAFTYPESLSKLILFDTSACLSELLGDIETSVKAFKDEPWYPDSFAALQKEWAGEYETDQDMSRLWADEVKFYFRRFDSRAEAYHSNTKHLAVRIAPLKVFNEKEATTMDLRPRLPDIQVPTLVIVGRHDFITNVAMARELASHIPNSQIRIFEKSGHFAHVEEPEKFCRTVEQFVFNIK